MGAAELPEPARAILHTLLDRFEQPGRRQVVRVRLTEHDNSAYFSPSDATPRRITHQALERLARDEILTLRWRRWEEGNWLDAVDLHPEGAAAPHRRRPDGPRRAAHAPTAGRLRRAGGAAAGGGDQAGAGGCARLTIVSRLHRHPR